MPRRFPSFLRFAIAPVAVLAIVGGGEDARATTFCVPTFSAACPDSGGNVKETDLEKAMGLQGKDGIPDQIVIPAGLVSENNVFEPGGGYENPGTYEPTGSDPLTVIGAGRGATILTSAGTGNIFLFNFGSNNSRAITLRDLTVRIPASFDDGLGSAFQLDTEDRLENVDIVSLNPESDGISSVSGAGNVFRDGEVRGEGSGSIGDAVSSSFGSLLVEDVTLRGVARGLGATGATAQLVARRVIQVGTGVYGAIAIAGTVSIENSVMTIDDGIALHASAAAADATLLADHVTVVNSGSGSPALEAKKFGGGAGDATVVASNSILRGFSAGYKAETAIGPGVGKVYVTARYSNLPQTGTSVNGTIDLATGNIDADPLLAPDLSLPPGSPSIDTGDPGAGLASDFLGALRPRDGNGDGVAVRDQGAFEYQPPSPPQSGGGPAADVTAPQTRIAKGPGAKLARGKAKFSFRSSEAGSRFRCKLDRGKPRSCRSPKRYSKLKPGRHAFKVWAIDAAGNKDPTPAKRSFRVPASS